MSEEQRRIYRRLYMRAYRKGKGKAAVRRAVDNYERKNPERKKAWLATRKLDMEPCQICHATGRTHGHHPDPSKPLEVIWLCALHHKHVHLQKVKNPAVLTQVAMMLEVA